jgi:acetoin utilization protein AcuB
MEGKLVYDDPNLALEIVESPRDRQSALVATVYLATVCSYLRASGAPTLTAECSSFAELEREVTRLKAECDALLEEAAPRFAAAGDRVAQGDQARLGEPVAAPAGRAKPPLKLDEELLVGDRMTRDVRTLHRNDKLSVADELMKAGRFRHAVVVERGEIVGVISQRDIFYGALAWSVGLGSDAHQKTLAAVAVKQVMQCDVVTVTPDTRLSEAARIMLESKVGCLPVVAAEGLAGILTEGDFLSMFTEAEVRGESR